MKTVIYFKTYDDPDLGTITDYYGADPEIEELLGNDIEYRRLDDERV